MSDPSTASVCTCSVFASCFCFRLLVGAPRAKALRGQTSSITGGLYRCDMDRDDCSRVEFDNMGKKPTDTRVVFTANVGVLILGCLCREPKGRKQTNAVDGSVGQQPGPWRQGHGKIVSLICIYIFCRVNLRFIPSILCVPDLRPSLPAFKQCGHQLRISGNYRPLLRVQSGPEHQSVVQ